MEGNKGSVIIRKLSLSFFFDWMTMIQLDPKRYDFYRFAFFLSYENKRNV